MILFIVTIYELNYKFVCVRVCVPWQRGMFINVFQEKFGCIPHGLSEAAKILISLSETELTREKVCSTHGKYNVCAMNE